MIIDMITRIIYWHDGIVFCSPIFDIFLLLGVLGVVVKAASLFSTACNAEQKLLSQISYCLVEYFIQESEQKLLAQGDL